MINQKSQQKGFDDIYVFKISGLSCHNFVFITLHHNIFYKNFFHLPLDSFCGRFSLVSIKVTFKGQNKILNYWLLHSFELDRKNLYYFVQWTFLSFRTLV